MIPAAFVDTIKEKTDLAALIGGYVDLAERGQDLVGLCPFDGGKKPTFTVSPEKKIWKCFKCGKGGSAINFIMEIEKLPFPQAVRFLAKKLELDVPEDQTQA